MGTIKNEWKRIPKNSFEKFTAHKFLKQLEANTSEHLQFFEIAGYDRKHLFWQKDPLAIVIRNRKMAIQKLDYMHQNPIQKHWNLCNDPINYRFSSARFYETGEDEFGMITHYMDRF